MHVVVIKVVDALSVTDGDLKIEEDLNAVAGVPVQTVTAGFSGEETAPLEKKVKGGSKLAINILRTIKA